MVPNLEKNNCARQLRKLRAITLAIEFIYPRAHEPSCLGSISGAPLQRTSMPNFLSPDLSAPQSRGLCGPSAAHAMGQGSPTASESGHSVDSTSDDRRYWTYEVRARDSGAHEGRARKWCVAFRKAGILGSDTTPATSCSLEFISMIPRCCTRK